MSTTYALPISTAEHFNHGHTYSHSHTRSHQRSRANSRLAPPFSLPRIPSESMVQCRDDLEHPFQDVQTEGHREEMDKGRIFRSHGLIPAPTLEPAGLLYNKRKSPSYSKMPHVTPIEAYSHQHRHFSKPTKLLLQSTEGYSLLHGILAEKDSRRIFYFMLLNLAFMLVQSTYGVLTGSLGLISDSVHMFFDCIALLMGICAAVMSKWPASVKFPYGYGKIDTLAGFANGLFLMLISVEIVYEAMERLFSGSELSRTSELLVVSSIGLLVNLVGIFAFEHGHAHDHGDSRHQHGNHDHLVHPNQSPTSASASPTKAKQANAGGHHHGGENMQGIYLHIVADALGSVSVVVSTLLVRHTGWAGFDPLASCMIAVLIFGSAVPLVVSTAKILLLSLNPDIEYNLRDILAGINEIRGVVGYAVPKFWLEDVGKKEGGHGHLHHDHDHAHAHAHSHAHHGDHQHQCQHHRKDSTDSSERSASEDPAVLGVIHIIASQQADLEDVRGRTSRYLRSKNMDIIVQVEREGEARCWCGGGLRTG